MIAVNDDPYLEVYDVFGSPLGHVRRSRVHPRLLADIGHRAHECPLCDGESEATASTSTFPGRADASDSGRILETPVTETGGASPEQIDRAEIASHTHARIPAHNGATPGGEVTSIEARRRRGGTSDGLATTPYDQCHVRQISEPTRLGSSDADD
jgi:hypothetical protein